MRLLLEAGADVHAGDRFGCTALHRAAGQCVSELIRTGADVHAEDEDGGQPLAAAARRGDVVAVQLLLAAGANVHVADKAGCTALHEAVWTNSKAECVRALIRQGRT